MSEQLETARETLGDTARHNANSEALPEGPMMAGNASSNSEATAIIKSWRASVKVHSAAESLFPMMSKDELIYLGLDIKDNGLHEPIAVRESKEDGLPVLLDGRNRLAAIELAYEDPEERIKAIKRALDKAKIIGDKINPETFVVSLNVHRRHLTTEQKRELIAKLLKQNPDRSDRATAKMAQVDHKTVASVRAELAAVGEIPQRKNTAGRKQSAHEAAQAGPPEQTLLDPPAQKRAKAVHAFITTFHAEPADTLEGFVKMLKDEGKRIDKISKEKRISLAQAFLKALNLSPSEVK